MWYAVALVLLAPAGRADELPEYRLKAGLLYNFVQFTDWPGTATGSFTLCVVGRDPFGPELDALRDKPVGARTIAVDHEADQTSLAGCAAVFIAPSSIGALPQILAALRDRPVLTVADSPGAARRGVVLNMSVVQGKVAFEVNLKAARAAHLTLSSKVLRLATEVIQ